jgi:hypothetical protein
MGRQASGLLNGMIQSGRAEILHEYTIMSCFRRSYEAKWVAECTQEYRRCLNLPNDVVSAIAVQSSATWGLDRSDQITGMNILQNTGATGTTWTCTF